MPMYSLIEYRDNHSKTSDSFWQYYRDQTHAAEVNSEPFKCKAKITGKTSADGNTKDDKMAVSLKYLSDFWITLEMSLISCEINFIVTWSSDRIICSATGATEFAMTDTKLYVSVVTFKKKDNAKLLLQLQLGIKRTINWNKYQSKVSIERQNHYLVYLIDPSFQGANRLFVLSSEDLHI